MSLASSVPTPASTTTATLDLGARERVLAADGLRGLAALAIVIHHASFVAATTFEEGVLGAIYARLDVGVPVFFALSGFLLFEPYLRRLVSDGSGTDSTAIKRFYRRRLVRIFPAYWTAFVIQLALNTIAVTGAIGFFFSFTLTHVYAGERAKSGITQSWSLATELGFYLVLPLFVILVARVVRGRTPHQRLLIAAAMTASWILISNVSRALVMVANPPGELNFRYTVIANADYFAVGMLFACLAVGKRLGGSLAQLHESLFRYPSLWYAGAFAALVITATQLGVPRGLEIGSGEVELARQFGYVLVAVGTVGPACCAGSRGPIQRFLASAPLVWLGLVSYGLYLWHQVFLSAPDGRNGWFVELFGWKLFEAPLWPLVAVTTVGSLALAAASWYLIERPLLERFR